MLDCDSLRAAARQNTGLENFGDPRYEPWFETLVEGLLSAGLHERGERGMAARLQLRLENRLRITDYVKRHPEVHNEDLGSPVFIIGLPRAGTTLLHRLMAKDPHWFTSPLWRLQFPAPDQRGLGGATRHQAAASMVERWHRVLPAFRRIHALHPDEVEECYALLENSFATPIWGMYASNPDYLKRHDEASRQDHQWAYDELALHYRILRSQGAGECLLAKDPNHARRIPEISAAFPGARFVVSVRDLGSVAASRASLVHALLQMPGDRLAPDVAGAHAVHSLTSMVDGIEAAADNPSVRLVDYPDVQSQPTAVASAVRQWCGVGLTPPATMAAQEGWLRDNEADKYGKHDYGLERFGIDPEVVAALQQKMDGIVERVPMLRP